MKLDDHLKELVLASRVTFCLLRVPVCVRMICSECRMRDLTVYFKYIQGKGDFNDEKCTACDYKHKKEAISCLLKICIEDEEDKRRQQQKLVGKKTRNYVIKKRIFENISQFNEI